MKDEEEEEESEEEKKPVKPKIDKKKLAKTIARLNIKTYAWAMVYPTLLKSSVKHIVRRKKEATMIQIPKRIDVAFNVMVFEIH